MNFSNTSIPRLRYLWLIASLVAGYGLVDFAWPANASVTSEQLRAYAGVLASAAASMSALAFAGAGLLYALLSVSMIKALHDAGALNRVVFDLLDCAGLWLMTLGSALIGSMPFFNYTSTAIIASATFAFAGILYFGPLGYAFWLLLSNAPKDVLQPIQHNWIAPTVLQPVENVSAQL